MATVTTCSAALLAVLCVGCALPENARPEGTLASGSARQLIKQSDDYAKDKQYAAALECAQKANTLMPGQPGTLWRIALCGTSTGDYPLALQSLEQLVLVDPEAGKSRQVNALLDKIETAFH